MENVFKSWKKDWSLVEFFFNKNEIDLIARRVKNVKAKTVVFCSFESRFAKSGGLGAVTNKILPYLKNIDNIADVILITPFYSNIIDETWLKKTGLTFSAQFDDKKIKVEMLEYTSQYYEPGRGFIKEYYLKAEGFFNARNRLHDPYLYVEDDTLKNNEAIIKNALLFCQAAPLAVHKLKLRENLIFHLQEWQTALISLTSKQAMLDGKLRSCATIQTMHNPFDSFIPWKSLAKIVEQKRLQKISRKFSDGLTAYQIGLQLVDAPITTVSENFARELAGDILQTKHFAPHLQFILKKTGVIGINNGPFHDFPSKFSSTGKLTIEEIKRIKSRYRKSLLEVLAEYNPSERFGDLTYKGDSITGLPGNIPIIIMAGRLDYSQKGYDILLQAIQRFTEDEIKVVLTPMPVKSSDLDYFRETASKCKGNLTVFPIKMQQGYYELQIGSTFGVMPSIYEPFGAAMEYMVKGTVNIARRTGGLVDQIEDGRCGFLYRENSAFYNEINIENFFKLKDQVQLRSENRWVQSMVDGLYETLITAINLFQNHRHEYYRLIIMGFKKAKSFNWVNSAGKYFEVYEMVNQGF